MMLFGKYHGIGVCGVLLRILYTIGVIEGISAINLKRGKI
jgi:hypothetical protein